MKLLLLAGLLVAMVLPLSASVYPASTNGNNIFTGQNVFSNSTKAIDIRGPIVRGKSALAAADGNARGSGSTDLQAYRLNAWEVAAANYSVICGGGGNQQTANGFMGFIGGGFNNTNDGGYSFIGGGDDNLITGAPLQSSILNGSFNVMNGCDYAFMSGGYSNYIEMGYFTTILGGKGNYINLTDNTVANGHGTILGGFSNRIAGVSRAWIIGDGITNTSNDTIMIGPSDATKTTFGTAGVNFAVPIIGTLNGNAASATVATNLATIQATNIPTLNGTNVWSGTNRFVITTNTGNLGVGGGTINVGPATLSSESGGRLVLGTVTMTGINSYLTPSIPIMTFPSTANNPYFYYNPEFADAPKFDVGITVPFLKTPGTLTATNGVVLPLTATPPSATVNGAQLWSDGTNLCVILRNSAGTITTNKLTMSTWP